MSVKPTEKTAEQSFGFCFTVFSFVKLKKILQFVKEYTQNKDDCLQIH